MQVKIQPSLRMGTILLLFLFTSEEACAEIFIKSVKLFIQPRNEVQRSTNVSLKCQAEASHTAGSHLNYKYIFYKNYHIITDQTNATDSLYYIPDARVSHSGRYKCAVVIEEIKKESSAKDLTVKGLLAPVLTVDKLRLTEGHDVTAVCTAEGETGFLTFFFRDGPEELYRVYTNSHKVEQNLKLDKGTVNMFCYYSINLGSTAERSSNSNVISVDIEELEIKPDITVMPSTDVTEGDNITFSCSVNMTHQRNSELRIIFSHGHNTLSLNMTHEDYAMLAKANDSGEYECISSLGGVHKSSSLNITVKEIFSIPFLSIHPDEVFEGEHFDIRCQISSLASRIQREDIKYSIFRDETFVIKDNRYSGTASKATNGKYVCKAEANRIIKESSMLLFGAKVLVSKPEITVDGPVIVEKPFWIRCHSENGSLPITYSLKRNNLILNSTKVSRFQEEARFLALISTPSDITSYMCEAKNNDVSIKMSERLQVTVIVPVGKPLLTVLPVPENIEEGNDVTLICGIAKGSPPISFRFYGSDHTAIHTTTVQSNSSSFVLSRVKRKNSGNYYCEAFNTADMSSRSDIVKVEVSLAMWKKALIAVFCMLLVALLVLFIVMRYKAKRVEVNNKESVWSERPPDLVDQDSLQSPNEGVVEYTEVVHPQPVDPTQIPLRKGTETVYSELQTSQGAPENINHQSLLEYAELNHDLPEPVD
ncbi:platelet endothelial cell adhesion molecule isoform X2 [Rhinichthys klamathensis goyatoka]|uniref:platelet endothelial cell adhesion molecule isoform X2 n=1 Tax=Rhinichthys klamathensis goyatoka TaxID=3034132 RepID=UPI0024B4D641|nr:platelet endothelial cell adhesion molecule isoform X2 [Rhinichthys klamathensis goyatoka]